MSVLNLVTFGRSSLTQWDGYYEQDGTKYRFRAEFVHSENRLRGRITDIDVTYSRLPIEDYLELSGLSPSEKTEQKQKVARSLGCADTDVIEVSREQTDKSHVKGNVDNHSIIFVKTYDSGVVITFHTNGFKSSFQTQPYSIRYEGTLSQDGKQISGKWLLHEKQANLLLEGSFVMNRI